eukprot:CAMPEP_0172722770 /NCGR_PEP_ID=MMETSP1074-20121228/82272_1 /TAXON_ID=2916 /ORGANISM="Ceratium fusus, Strain PA161109" /LENGTH=120 /DNA_ID=CAMNT_0013548845 /DNA_START=263 /DNA_END=625 /DNA_ORIENTATION=-
MRNFFFLNPSLLQSGSPSKPLIVAFKPSSLTKTSSLQSSCNGSLYSPHHFGIPGGGSVPMSASALPPATLADASAATKAEAAPRRLQGAVASSAAGGCGELLGTNLAPCIMYAATQLALW